MFTPGDGFACFLFVPTSRRFQLLGFVVNPSCVLMRPRQAGVAEGGGLEAGVVVSKAGGALPLGEDSADDALPRRSLDDVRHVQQLAGQDSIVHLELSAKPAGIIREGFKLKV